MMKTIVLATSIALVLLRTAGAVDLTQEAINSASLQAISPERPAQEAAPQPDPAIVRLQVLLDRAGSSPGVIDGHYGENVTKAVAGFERLQNLSPDGKLNPDVVQRLSDTAPAIQAYRITEKDAADLVDKIPKDYANQAKMKHLGYTSIAEKLSERFHMDIDLLKALNSGVGFSVGATVLVAMPGDPRTGAVKHIEVHRKSGQVLAFAADGTLITAYPATIGSEETPSPSGTHKVKGVARMPPYIYNPKINFQQGKNKKILKLPSGPNGPVGTVWIDLTEPTYGIHGTPEPSLIDKVGSHGCVRLTNWDAEELAGMVKPGVVVKFSD
ncbi:L,D-transpeptidase family protein [Rhizobium grahamii]|uniref:Putative exported ErfK/YbiS/YhnG family protein n=1 Tax=Rhizobium grahamii CCGE 502 TaxID=990285 RepID=S3HTX3_9HYPH|nr:L,D-transpeptidase [Rhizobium grahamii]EPE96631.1 putative exported ErfK/YbiS/YhnG family protein [Rhizobium grahamii CCGE 502]